jgi:hypothetical protein
MNSRLARIQNLVLATTIVSAIIALGSGLTMPLGIVLGGLAGWLDFVVIKQLAGAMLTRRPTQSHVVPLALAKSLILVSVPALALLLPTSLVNGASFAIGVTMLPAAIVVDACLGVPQVETREV